MKKWKYYAVAGFNGYGVYDDYSKVLKSKIYIQGFYVKSFVNERAALDYAEKLYYDLQIQRYDNYHPVKRGYKYEGINWFYFTNYDLICPFIVWGNEYRSF